MPNYKKMSRSETIQINDLLKEHLVNDGERIYNYTNDMTDDKIASLVGGNVNKSHVAGLRLELFGTFGNKVKDSNQYLKFKELSDKFNIMQNEYNKLVDNFAALCIKHEKLCDSLSLSQIANVRHLR